jgi:putative transposase
MPRAPRPDLAGIAQHVVQRGNDRQPCFFQPCDYDCYLSQLREAALRHVVAIHAYVLMTNHVHLLATPRDTGGISSMMQHLGRRFVPYINARYRRTGTLWEGRFRACLVDSGRYVLACHRYIELNPVRAAMVASPIEYGWSSYRANAEGHTDPTLTPHADVLRLGVDGEHRRTAYRALFDSCLSEEQAADIRAHLDAQRAYGGDRFRSSIERQLGRSMQVTPRGRPRASVPAGK